MRAGDFLIAKVNEERDITSGDGTVGKFIIKVGDKFKIKEIYENIEQFSIDYYGTELWFAYSIEEPQYFVEDYRTYFYDYTKTQRKLKLENLDDNK